MRHTSNISQFVILCAMILFCGSFTHIEAKKRSKATHKKPSATASTAPNDELPESAGIQVRLRLTDGTRVAVDDAWESEQGIWYRQSGITHLVPRDRVKSIERGSSAKLKPEPKVAKVTEVKPTQTNTEDL